MKVVRVVVCEIPTIFPQTWQFAVEGIWCGIIRDGRSYLGRPYHTDVTLRPRIRKYFKYENYCCAVLFFLFKTDDRVWTANWVHTEFDCWAACGCKTLVITLIIGALLLSWVCMDRPTTPATKPFGWKSKAWWSHSVNRVWKCMPFCLKTWIKIGPK